MNTQTFCISYLGAALLLMLGLASCADSGIDPETAVIIGEGKDTITQIDLQKAYVLAGIIGIEGNVVTDGFVTFRREFTIDSLRNGAVTGLRNIYLNADFGTPSNQSDRHAFYPLHTLEVFIPYLKVDPGNLGSVMALEEYDRAKGLSGLKAVFRHNGDSVDLHTSIGAGFNSGYAQITEVDTAQKMTRLFVKANLVNTVPPSAGTRRIVDEMQIEIAIELPYKRQ